MEDSNIDVMKSEFSRIGPSCRGMQSYGLGRMILSKGKVGSVSGHGTLILKNII